MADIESFYSNDSFVLSLSSAETSSYSSTSFAEGSVYWSGSSFTEIFLSGGALDSKSDYSGEVSADINFYSNEESIFCGVMIVKGKMRRATIFRRNL